MVKVLGIDTSEVQEITCRNCASRLEFTRNEVVHSTYTDYGGGTDKFDYITCPTCGKKVEVDV